MCSWRYLAKLQARRVQEEAVRFGKLLNLIILSPVYRCVVNLFYLLLITCAHQLVDVYTVLSSNVLFKAYCGNIIVAAKSAVTFRVLLFSVYYMWDILIGNSVFYAFK